MMMPIGRNVLLLACLLGAISSAYSLYCYRCVSTIAGCGDQLNIRLQRWHKCQDPPNGGGENFCVKVIEKRDGEEYITRECLQTLQTYTHHREIIPTVQRHGYCSHGRNNDPNDPLDEDVTYCFCNDWNGCNTASWHRGCASKMAIAIGLFVCFLHKLFALL